MAEAKKILFVITGGREWIGGLHYIKNLIKTVKQYNAQANAALKVDLLVYEHSQKGLFSDIAGDIDNIYVYSEHLGRPSLVNKARWLIKRKMFDILHPRLDEFITSKGYDFAYPVLTRKKFKNYRFAEWIPDFQYKHYPDGSNKEEIEARKEAVRFVTANAPLIYLSSEHARGDCEELSPGSRDKLAVMQFCVFSDTLEFGEPLSTAREAYSIPGKYFMVSNLLAPTKNLQVVIRAVSILKRKGLSVPVVVSGDLHDYRNPDFKHLIFQLINSENVREEMLMLGLLPRTRQKQLLVHSLAIIQPSRFEGWNTIVEEAKWLDKQILLSDIPVHLEQAPPRATYFTDNDAQDLAAKMEAIYTSTEAPADTRSVGISPSYTKRVETFAEHFITTSLQG